MNVKKKIKNPFFSRKNIIVMVITILPSLLTYLISGDEMFKKLFSNIFFIKVFCLTMIAIIPYTVWVFSDFLKVFREYKQKIDTPEPVIVTPTPQKDPLLERLGIIALKTKRTDSNPKGDIEETEIINEAQRSYTYTGLSAYYILETDKYTVISSRSDKIRFNFNLLNPKNYYSLLFHYRWENLYDIKDLNGNIEHVISQIKKIKGRRRSAEYDLFDYLPCFRIIKIDDTKMYVGVYQKEKCGYYSPLLELKNTGSDSLYSWFDIYVNKLKEYQQRNKFEKSIISQLFQQKQVSIDTLVENIRKEPFCQEFCADNGFQIDVIDKLFVEAILSEHNIKL